MLPRGSGVMAIAGRLADAGVVADARLFAYGTRAYGAHRSLRAGEYRFPARASMADVMAKLAAGDMVQRRFTVPEGLTSREIVALLAATEGLVGEVAEVPPDGTLLPETYYFTHGDTRAAVIRRMQEAMRATLDDLWRERAEDLPLDDPTDAVVLASIVERETALAHERPRVAGVFVNRLRLGMRLQSDPTVAYAVTDGAMPLDRPLTQSDLAFASPYNTYVSGGLPPGPIGNPGRAAHAPVVRPADTRDLYFVADGSGGHAFARTYAEHRRNVQAWRRIERDRLRAAGE